MEAGTVREEIRLLFDAFVEAFRTFSVESIADLYAVPYMAVQSDGAAAVHGTHESVREYFEGVLNDYRQGGCNGCRYADLCIYEMGVNSTVGTVTWELTGPENDVLSSWQESYHLVREEGRWRIRVSTDHA